jgi:hypothetical protein
MNWRELKTRPTPLGAEDGGGLEVVMEKYINLE